MARPIKLDNEPIDTVLSLRVTRSQREYIEEKARQRGQSMAEFIRMLISQMIIIEAIGDENSR